MYRRGLIIYPTSTLTWRVRLPMFSIYQPRSCLRRQRPQLKETQKLAMPDFRLLKDRGPGKFWNLRLHQPDLDFHSARPASHKHHPSAAVMDIVIFNSTTVSSQCFVYFIFLLPQSVPIPTSLPPTTYSYLFQHPWYPWIPTILISNLLHFYIPIVTIQYINYMY
jgi:hypothetical protein